MKNLWQADRGWAERRWRKKVSWWERQRLQGEARYAREAALKWGGFMIAFTALDNYFVADSFSYFKFLPAIPLYLAIGYILGLWDWRLNERQYQKRPGKGDAPPAQAD